MKNKINLYITKFKLLFLAFALLLSLCSCQFQKPDDSVYSSSSGVSSVTSSNQSSSNVDKTDNTAKIFDQELYKGKLTVRYFYVKPNGDERDGDCSLVICPDGTTILVDSGTKYSGKQIVDHLKQLGIKKIDYAFISHMHSDHIGGFPEIINNFEIGKMVLPTLHEYDTSLTRALKDALATHKVETVVANKGDIYKISDDVEITVLQPSKDEINIPDSVKLETAGAALLNNYSSVHLLKYKNNTFLFTGDLYKDGELSLVKDYGEKIDIDVLKVPHHGYATSSTLGLINTTTPKIAVIMNNIFCDLDTFEKYKSNVDSTYVTGVDGTVLIVSDGDNLTSIKQK